MDGHGAEKQRLDTFRRHWNVVCSRDYETCCSFSTTCSSFQSIDEMVQLLELYPYGSSVCLGFMLFHAEVSQHLGLGGKLQTHLRTVEYIGYYNSLPRCTSWVGKFKNGVPGHDRSIV